MNGVRAQRMLKARYWVATHDEVKKGGGFVSWFLKRRVWTVEDALREARREMDALREARREMDADGCSNGNGHGEEGNGRVWDEDEFEDVRFKDLGNGESMILE